VAAAGRTAAPTLAGLAHHEPLVIAAVVVVVVIGYRVSLWLHPLTTCRRCGGSGKTPGCLGGRSFCARCGGDGLVPRLGARALVRMRRSRERSWR
jgi:hypothetical protein